MVELGKIDNPEQYYPGGNYFLLTDSVDAYDYFSELRGGGGGVCLLKAKLNSVTYPYVLFWAYVSLENKKIISMAPVFKIEYTLAFMEAEVVDMELINQDKYFYWNGAVHAVVFTDTDQIIVRQVRSILCSKDMDTLIELASGMNCEDIYPVKLFKRSTGEFLSIYWAFEVDDDKLGFEPVCHDDSPVDFNDEFLKDTFFHTIDIGERVIFDNAFHLLKYQPDIGYNFERLPFVVSKEQLKSENIPEELFNPKIVSLPRRNYASSPKKAKQQHLIVPLKSKRKS